MHIIRCFWGVGIPMSKCQLSVIIVNTFTVTLSQVKEKTMHGLTHRLIDNIVSHPIHAQFGGHICHRDKFGIDARHDLEFLVVRNDVQGFKIAKLNEDFFHFAIALQRILSVLERFSDAHSLLVCAVAFFFCDRMNFNSLHRCLKGSKGKRWCDVNNFHLFVPLSE